jgi:hypothetical protein
MRNVNELEAKGERGEAPDFMVQVFFYLLLLFIVMKVSHTTSTLKSSSK